MCDDCECWLPDPWICLVHRWVAQPFKQCTINLKQWVWRSACSFDWSIPGKYGKIIYKYGSFNGKFSKMGHFNGDIIKLCKGHFPANHVWLPEGSVCTLWKCKIAIENGWKWWFISWFIVDIPMKMSHVRLPEAKLQISWGDLHPYLVFSEESFKGSGRNTADTEAWLLGAPISGFHGFSSLSQGQGFWFSEVYKMS